MFYVEGVSLSSLSGLLCVYCDYTFTCFDYIMCVSSLCWFSLLFIFALFHFSVCILFCCFLFSFSFFASSSSFLLFCIDLFFLCFVLSSFFGFLFPPSSPLPSFPSPSPSCSFPLWFLLLSPLNPLSHLLSQFSLHFLLLLPFRFFFLCPLTPFSLIRLRFLSLSPLPPFMLTILPSCLSSLPLW